MSNVLPGYVFTGSSDPITYSKLNALGTPTVTPGTGEITGTMMASNNAIPGFSLAANTKAIFASGAVTFSATIGLTIDATHPNVRTIACTSNTGSTITPTTGGTAGEPLWIIFSTDGTGGNVITYAAPFVSIGTHTLTGSSKKFTAFFLSDGTSFCEVSRSAALT